ncbi:hypothetical protein WICMUC_001891 [Wickerhamomyces mucosus]|uniref:Uncharacterized protein n=1 Tax=Wickerhamomyces mucosus TaxID=1378264 RepID=A0A9P8TG45_9ASCO|nr:hypothetical protein WICMUC_001891 [Wickerhamomyces mucosus]
MDTTNGSNFIFDGDSNGLGSFFRFENKSTLIDFIRSFSLKNNSSTSGSSVDVWLGNFNFNFRLLSSGSSRHTSPLEVNVK